MDFWLYIHLYFSIHSGNGKVVM